MTDDWWPQLIARYPDLFRWMVGDRAVTSGYPAVNDGWRDIVEKAVERMAAAVRGRSREPLRIIQIKEKLGGLRIYYDSGRLDAETFVAVEEAVDLAEARAGCTCDICGRESQLYNKNGWLATRCEKHSKGNPVPLSGDGNVIVKYATEDDRRRVISRRRYDRAHDRFVDITGIVDMVCFRCGDTDKDHEVIGRPGRIRCPLCGTVVARPAVPLDELPADDARLVRLVLGDAAGTSYRNE